MKKKKKFKNLFKNLKKTNKYYKSFLFIILFIYVISIGFISHGILLLKGIETLLRVLLLIAILFYLIMYIFISLAMLISKKHGLLILIMVLTLFFSAANIFGYYYIEKTYKIVDHISKEKIIYTTNLIALDKNIDIKTVGMIKNEKDIEGYVLPQEYLAINNKKYKLEYYEEYTDLLNALYDKNIDAIFITANYAVKYNEDRFENIADETFIIDKYSKKLDNQDKVLSTNKSVTEPFSILLLGVDSAYDGLSNNAAFNGDSIMLVTFNPKTLSSTVFSIPRDTYVPIACNNNKSFKINSAAGYGTKCMINTIENLTDIKIDYYVKINFKGVVALVEALDGITIDVDEPDFSKNLRRDCNGMICEQNSSRKFGQDTVYIKPGKNVKLNGEQALAYARNRHQWALSDFKRIEHQQAVVTGIINKAKTINNLSKFYNVLNAVSNNMDTNMDTTQILNFYNVGKNILLNSNFDDNEFINIQKTYLTGYDLSIYRGKSNVYTFQYYEESLDEIKTAMKENLELIKPTMIKTFNFSINDTYVVPTIGKTYSTIKRNETLPDFVGKKLSYAEAWTSARNISITKNYIEDQTCVNDTVLSQGTHAKTLINTLSNISLNICKNTSTTDNQQNNQEINNVEETKPENNQEITTTTTTTTKPVIEEEKPVETD